MSALPETPTTHRPGPPSTFELATSYLDLGLSVLPVRTDRKRPFIRWKEFQSRRASVIEIADWLRSWPSMNVGVVCGAVSGNLCVVDVDPRNGGDQSIKGLHLPPTATVATGSGPGAWHYYFRSREPIGTFKLLTGVDLQADGGFVVAPPSIHPISGKPYVWADGLAPADVGFADLPDWVLDKARVVESLGKRLPTIMTAIAAEHFSGLAVNPVCVQTLEAGTQTRPGERHLAVVNLLDFYKARGLPVEEAVRRAQGMIHRLPSTVSQAPIPEQLDHVVRAARTVYGSPDPRYSFQCKYMIGMKMPCAGADCPLFEVAGRPQHKRKWIKMAEPPTPSLPTPTVTLEEARVELSHQLQQVADNPDGNIHVFKVETGVGKTRAAALAFLSKPTIWMSAMHKQLDDPERIAQELGASYCRFPKLTAENCINDRVVDEHMKRGLNYTKVICPGCELRNKCDYLSAQKPGDAATSLLLVQKYHEMPTFYDGHENHKRQFVVFDEDPMAAFRPQRKLTLGGLASYRALLRRVLDYDARGAGVPGLIIPDMMIKQRPMLAGANLDVQARLVDLLLSVLAAGQKPGIPADLVSQYPAGSFEMTLEWVYEMLKSDFRSRKGSLFINYFQEIHELLTGQAQAVVVDHGAISFSVCLPPPTGKTIVVLDATATASDFRRVVGDRRIIEHVLPPVGHSSRIIQLLDANWSRQSVAWDTVPLPLAGGKMSKPRRALGMIMAKINVLHPAARVGVITHKGSVEHVRAQLPQGFSPRFGYFNGQRGSNEFVDVDVLVVIGSPKINADAIHAKAVSLCGHDVPHEGMVPVWRRVQGVNTVAEVEVRFYKSPEMQTAYSHCVTRELLQALGRARYVFGGKTIYLLTNEPLDGSLPVELMVKADLLGEDEAARSDSVYPQVAALVSDRFRRGDSIGIGDVRAALSGVARQTLSTHLSRAAKALGGVRQGQRWALRRQD